MYLLGTRRAWKRQLCSQRVKPDEPGYVGPCPMEARRNLSSTTQEPSTRKLYDKAQLTPQTVNLKSTVRAHHAQILVLPMSHPKSKNNGTLINFLQGEICELYG